MPRLPQLERAPLDALTAVGALLVTLLMWGGAAGGFFIKDDFVWLRCAAETVNLGPGHAFNLSVANFLRPVPQLVFAALYRAGGLSPALYHWAGLVVHACCAVLLGRLTRQLSGRPLAGVLCAALFLLDPVVDEPVIWIAALNESLHALALLATLLLWTRLVRDEARRGPVYAGALLTLLLTFGSKETSVVALPLLALVHLGLHLAGRARPLRWLAYLPPALLLGGYLAAQATLQRDAAALASGAYAVEPAALLRLLYDLGLLLAATWPPLAAAALGLALPPLPRLSAAQLRIGLVLLGAAALVLLPYAPFRHQAQASRYFYLAAMVAAMLGGLALARLREARPGRLAPLLIGLALAGAAIFGLREARHEVRRYLHTAAQTERFVRAAARLPAAPDGALVVEGAPLEGQHLGSMLWLYRSGARAGAGANRWRWDPARGRLSPQDGAGGGGAVEER